MPGYFYKTVLKNGTSVYFRFLKTKDKEWIKAGYKGLSYRSQYFRFISPPRELSEKDLKYLTEIDYINHVAIIAVAIRDSHKIPIGVARYIKLSESPCSAEYAITIADSFQGMGIGTTFLKLLVDHAKGNNVCELIGYVLNENYAMLRILEHYNTSRLKEEGSMFKITIDLREKA